MTQHILAIDVGTTSTRVMIFNQHARPISKHQIELQQYFPQPGWFEHDPEEIWQATLACCHLAVQQAKLSFQDITSIGITNQRETTVIWERSTGKPIYPAIVWADRRTANLCASLRLAGHDAMIQTKTGLLLDPYFSASKIHWLLQSIPQARQRAERGELAFGTIDSFLLWHLTQGAIHATDASNASRTSLFNIHTQQWDEELLALFNIPATLLPRVLDSSADFGVTYPSLFDREIPIHALVGDQQAALVGQTCFQAGMIKSTYGTGAFLMLNTGNQAIKSNNQLLTTIAYRLQGEVTYALEGGVFSTGSAIQWLRDSLTLFNTAQETAAMAASVENNGGVYFVPAFTGLGAPYWTPDVRACLQGITRDTQPAHIVRAALEAVAYQTQDLLAAMVADGAGHLMLSEIRVDGGMVTNDWLLQFMADILNLPVTRSTVNETTALGAAYLAGLYSGFFSSLEQIAGYWQREKTFTPQMTETQRAALYHDWEIAVRRLTS